MSLIKCSLSSLLICSFFLFSCKGEVSDIKNKAKEVAEKSSETLSDGVSAIEEKAIDVKENATDLVNETGEKIKEGVEDVKEIVAPSSNNKPVDNSSKANTSKPHATNKPNTTTSNTTTSNTSTSNTSTPKTNTSKPKPTSSTSTPTQPSKSEVVKVESTVEAVSDAASSSTKPSKVLKEIDKASSEKEKVEVGKISKPNGSASKTTKIDNAQAEFGHAPFNALLQKVVSGKGVVDYKQLKANQQDLNSYCKSLEANAPASSWSKNQKLAYWLNAYNAYTLKLIVENYPLNSITDLNGGKPWDKKWINLDSKTLSLNDIENVIIRPTFKDPRIHFAVNCAAKSCPPLANYAFTSRNVDSKLDTRTKSFINSSSNEISADKVVISKIFDWYGEDFGNLIAFINEYSNVKVNEGAKVEYQDYNWDLNGK